jgi:poly-gamma-glutamate capsule biosynthesis protein CapA/YwtB (metallophosphatase superfamily)
MKMILTGDVNLMGVDDAAVPFVRVADELRAADAVFSNLECCLYQPPEHSHDNEGFFASPRVAGEALTRGGIQAVGIANNVNYGEAAICASVARLATLGIAATGAGADRAAARAPAILVRDGMRIGFLQRTSVYWPTNHEARERAPGVAVIQGHTAYHVPTGRIAPGVPPPNRPGVPPVILTWADPASLQAFRDDVTALRASADIVVASCHWGLGRDVLRYMTEIAHAAIDAGADLVIGHGPHYELPIEVYRGKPIFYGLGSFSFHTGHGGKQHGDWLGLMARVGFARGGITDVAFQFVRHNARNETVPCALAREGAALDGLATRSAALGATLTPRGDEVAVALPG